MKRSTFLAATAGIAAVFGLGMLLAPDMFFALYGIAPGDASSLFARSLGCSLMAVAVINWMARNAGDSAAMRAILAGNIVLHVIGIFLDASAVLAGTMNAQGWGSIILHIVFAAGFVYYFVNLSRSGKST